MDKLDTYIPKRYAVREVPYTYWLILTIVGYFFTTIMVIAQPLALIFLEKNFKNVELDILGTISLIAIFLLGCLSFPTLALSILFFKNNKASSYNMWPQLIIAIIYLVIGVPTFVFIFIEMVTHPSMVHSHIDIIEVIIVGIDFVCGFLGQGMLLGSHKYPKKN